MKKINLVFLLSLCALPSFAETPVFFSLSRWISFNGSCPNNHYQLPSEVQSRIKALKADSQIKQITIGDCVPAQASSYGSSFPGAPAHYEITVLKN